MITDKDVKHIAKLARLRIKDDEISKFANQLSSILNYVEQLNELDTSTVDETSQVTGLKNVVQEDQIIKKCEGGDLLLCSGLPKERGQIRVKPVITND